MDRTVHLMTAVAALLVLALAGHCCMPLVAAAVAAGPAQHCGPEDAAPEATEGGCCLLLAAETARLDRTLAAPEISEVATPAYAAIIDCPRRSARSQTAASSPVEEDLLTRICVLRI